MVIIALYLELYLIPDTLFRTVQLSPVVAVLIHIFAVITVIIASGIIGARLNRKMIFDTHERLVMAHMNTMINAISNLATGRWSSDGYTHRDAFKTGAVLGHKLGLAQGENREISEAMVLEGLERLALPTPTQAGGQSTDIVDEMGDYLDDIGARRRRLSGEDGV